MKKAYRGLLPVFAVVIAFAAGCSRAEQTTGSSPQLSASDQRKAEEMSRQAEINFKTAQINNSNLPPDQKQSLLRQVKESSGK